MDYKLINFAELKEQKEFVLDVSFLPYIKFLAEASVKFYVPDILDKLIAKVKENKKNSGLLQKLIEKWYPFKKPKIDVEKIVEAYQNLKHKGIVEIIGENNIDNVLLKLCVENIQDKDLVTEFSEHKNLLGETIGKILGFSLKAKKFIIAKTTGLGLLIRYKVPVIYHSVGRRADNFIDEKKEFFDRLMRRDLHRRIPGSKFIIWVSKFYMNGIITNIIDP